MAKDNAAEKKQGVAQMEQANMPAKRSIGEWLIFGFVKLGVLPVLLVVAIVVFSSMSEHFLTARNLTNVARQSTYLTIVAIGQMLALLTGGFDPQALFPAKKFFGAARKIEGGGSLTIIGTCLVDTGSKDATPKIGELYGAKVFNGSDPLKHGFETPRNESIAQATGDWILWIDADEELQGFNNLRKYLRNSVYDGFRIRQHHF